MPRTLKDDMTADLYATALNVDEFGEWVTYWPAVGPSRRLVANIVTKQEDVIGPVVDHDKETITVLVGKDESHDLGGVSLPVRKGSSIDRLTRDLDAGLDVNQYVFTGKSERMPGGWKLTFERRKMVTVGTEHRG